MPCPSCGASYSGTNRCIECGTAVLSSTELDTKNNQSDEFEAQLDFETSQNETPRRSTLLEFPGVARSSVPEWRRELSERVREVQERRAREAAQEAEAERVRLAQAAAVPAPPLELLPQATAPTINPLVAAALRRIERANQKMPTAATHARAAAAVAYATEEELESSPDEPILNSAATIEFQQPTIDSSVVQPEKTHNLVVVPSTVTTTTNSVTHRKIATKRLISDHDPSLNYLDAVPTGAPATEATDHRGGIVRRLCGAVVDLLIAALLFSPFAAAVELTNGDWHRLRTIAFAAIVGTIVPFLYFTAATALTGRTVGMRMMSLKIVDRRTGLIPTGAQAAGRAIVYLGSLLALGLPAAYALLNREGYTVHDQMTSTMVVRQ